MNIQSALNKEVFIPRDEQLLVAVEVQRRKRKRMSFLPTGAKGDYTTFICVSVTNTWPQELIITKLKQFSSSSSFVRRQWTVEQLRQVNGINPVKDSPEFDLVFDNSMDQWVASSSAEKCIFIQILYQACQAYCQNKAESLGKTGKLFKVGHQERESHEVGTDENESQPGSASRILHTQQKIHVDLRQPEFINCQSKLTRDACTMTLVIYHCKAFVNRIKNTIFRKQRPAGQGESGKWVRGGTMGKVIKKISMSLGKRGERLMDAENRTVELIHKAQQFGDTAHKLALKFSK